MARADEIRRNARKTYQWYLQDENYQKLLELQYKISPTQRKEVYYDAVMGYVQGLKKAIEDDDLVVMRRHENPKYYAESFINCIERIGQLKQDKEEVEQITFHLNF